jgi:hypothetical protein
VQMIDLCQYITDGTHQTPMPQKEVAENVSFCKNVKPFLNLCLKHINLFRKKTLKDIEEIED